jgi:streptogramin lyase
VRPICTDRAGNIWIGTDGGGLYRVRDGVVTPFGAAEGLPNRFIRALLPDKEGNLWIGTDGGGVYRFRDGKFSPFSTRQGLSNDFTMSLFEDREGSLWIGTSGGGLNRLRDGAFTNLTTKDGLESDVVRAVMEDSKGRLWIATTGGGLTRIGDGDPFTYRAENGLASDLVFSIHEDQAGRIWAGTDGAGVTVIDGDRLRTYTTKDGLASDRVRTICGDREGNIWLGTTNGLSRFDGRGFHSYTLASGLPGTSIRALLPAAGGGVWIGADGGGFSLLLNDKFKTWKPADGLSSPRIFALHEDSRGVLWIGTSGGGLNRLANGKLTSIRSKDGLFDDVVFTILEDLFGSLWMTCNKGVFRVSRQELDDFAEGKLHNVRSIAYGTADGMKSAECNGGSPGGFRSRDGRLLFPTILGLAAIDSSRIPVNTLPPPVRIEELVVDKEQLSPDPQLRIAPGKEQFEFHYTALSLLVPSRVRFRYKLEGLDRSWIEAGSRRTAYYTNLAPGDYTFRVMACNNDGIWNEKGASIAFTLEPFFYQTRWFTALCVGLAGLTAAGIFRLRLQGLENKRRELERLVTDRTSLLQERTEELQRAQEQLEKLSTTSAGVLEDPATWARSVAREMANSIGAEEIGIFIIENQSFVPLASTTLRAPDWSQLREAQRRDGFLERATGTIVPLLGMTGEPRGVLVVNGPGVVWGDVQKRIIANLARHLGTALDLRSLRERLTTSENQRVASRNEMHRKGVQLAAICPICHRVFADSISRCPADSVALDWSRLFPLHLEGRYLLQELLGEGGMGTVLSARDERLDRDVAVKVIRPEHLRDVSVRLRFEREARIVAQIQDPGVVAVFDAGEMEDGSGFLVMENLRGMNLFDLLRMFGPGRAAQVARLVRQAGAALHRAHGEGVVHRDIKPANIFLVPQPSGFQTKILDFGIAKSLHMDAQLTRTGTIVGTPAYMAPEQVGGENVDARADLYSFAAVVYEALSGRPVVRSIDVARIFLDVLSGEPEPISSLVAGLPAEVDAAFATALAKHPQDRPANLAIWLETIAPLLEACPADATKGWPEPIPSSARDRTT